MFIDTSKAFFSHFHIRMSQQTGLGCKNSRKYEHRFSESAPPLKLLKLQNTSKEKLGRVSMTREREALCCDSFTFILPFIFFFFATFFIVERFPLFHNSCIKYKYINKRTKIRGNFQLTVESHPGNALPWLRFVIGRENSYYPLNQSHTKLNLGRLRFPALPAIGLFLPWGLNDSSYYFPSFWLAAVISSVSLERHSIKKRSTTTP